MNWINYIGIFAGVLTTVSFIPQVIKVWLLEVTLQTGDIIGVSSWSEYGFLIIDFPIVIANAATIFLLIFIIITEIIYRNNSQSCFWAVRTLQSLLYLTIKVVSHHQHANHK